MQPIYYLYNKDKISLNTLLQNSEDLILHVNKLGFYCEYLLSSF